MAKSQIFEKKLRERFREYLKQLPKTKNKKVIFELFDILKTSEEELYLFGGFAKDIFLKRNKAIPRDIDIVVNKSNLDSLVELFSDYAIERSRFNGYKIKFKGLDVDIWPLEKTWAFANKEVDLLNINSLAKTTFLNIESIAIELFPGKRTRRIIVDGFEDAIENEILELNLGKNPFPELNIARALYAGKNLKFKFGPKLVSFISENLKTCKEEEILNIYERKYGLTRRKRVEIKDILGKIKSYSSNGGHYFNQDIQIQLGLFE